MSLHWKFFWSPSDQKNYPQKILLLGSFFWQLLLDGNFFPKYPKKKPKKGVFWVFPMDKFQFF
jgi:hypothetical protein